MVDFIGAMNLGLEAADKLSADRKEIRAVIAEASRQIFDATGGVIKIDLRKFDKPQSSMSRLAELALAAVARETIDGLALVGRDGDKEVVSLLASWTTSKGGYPVKMQHSGSEITCHDKSGLEEGIAKVLASPTTGQQLRSKLNAAGVNHLIKPKTSTRRRV
jgi:hypothetical protein